MKILVVDENPFDKNANPYIREVILAAKSYEPTIQVDCGIENFWNDKCFGYDIIHFMYCHLALTKKRTAKDLDTRLEEIKKQTKKIFVVATCHNLSEHYSSATENAYDIVYKHCAQIYHLWQFSLDFANKNYPNASNVFLEHPIYTSLFSARVEKTEAQRYLGLQNGKKYILCMGAFRDKEERDFLISLADALKDEGFVFLAPSFYHYTKRRNLIKMFAKMLKYFCFAIYGRTRFPNIIFTGKHSGAFVPESEFKYFYAAADICFLQRLKILNSGNLLMAFCFGKVVCGPNTGNVGQILNQFGNVVFNPQKPMSAVDAIRKAYELSKTDLGDKNKAYAHENWDIEKIGKKQAEYYKTLICAK